MLKHYSPTVTHGKTFVLDFCVLWITAYSLFTRHKSLRLTFDKSLYLNSIWITLVWGVCKAIVFKEERRKIRTKREKLRGKFKRWKTKNAGKVDFKDWVKTCGLLKPFHFLRAGKQTRRHSTKKRKTKRKIQKMRNRKLR